MTNFEYSEDDSTWLRGIALNRMARGILRDSIHTPELMHFMFSSENEVEIYIARIIEILEEEGKGSRLHFVFSTLNGSDESIEFGGFAAVFTFHKRAVIDTLWVEKKFRGQGVGKSIVESIKKLADSTGTVVSLQCMTDKVDFYRKLGFMDAGAFSGDTSGGKFPVLNAFLGNRFMKYPRNSVSKKKETFPVFSLSKNDWRYVYTGVRHDPT
jgi:GNAT superfamily N-acetyltransferase